HRAGLAGPHEVVLGDYFDVQEVIGHQLAFLLNSCPFAFNIIKTAHVVEGLFGNMVQVAICDGLETFDGVLDRNGGAFDTGELLSSVGVLGKELFHSTCTTDGDPVCFGSLVYTQNGDDILQFFVLLQNLLDAGGNFVVFLAYILWVQNTGG